MIQFIRNKLIQSDYDKHKVIFFSLTIIILEIFRIYCQSFFPDIPNYKSLFEEIDIIHLFILKGSSSDYFISGLEIGYVIFISIFKFFSNNFYFFLFFVSILEWLVFYSFCKKFKIDFINSIPIYIAFTFLTFQIGMLRQALAFCFFLIALINIDKKLLFVIFILLGLSFHTSIIFCFFLFWVNKPINKNIYLLLFLIAVIIYVFKIDIINFSLPYFEVEDSIRSARANYYVNMVDRPNSYFGIGFWERIVLFFSMYIIQSRLISSGKVSINTILIFNLGMVSILFQLFLFSSPTITSRLRYYVILFPVIFISQFIYLEYKKKSAIVFQFLFLIYLFMYLFYQASYLN